MKTLKKAFLACMSAMALADKEIIDLNKVKDLHGNAFNVDIDDVLEFQWTGPAAATPKEDPKHLKIRKSVLNPAPYTVTEKTECQDDTDVNDLSEQLAYYHVIGPNDASWGNATD